MSYSDQDVGSPTIDIRVHHGGRILTTNKLYTYWGGEDHMICNVKTSHVNRHSIKFLVSKHLCHYNDVVAYYYRVPTVEMSDWWSLRKIQKHDVVLPLYLKDVPIGHALDIYLVHSRYPILIDPNTQRWLRRHWESSGFISGHVEAKRRKAKKLRL